MASPRPPSAARPPTAARSNMGTVGISTATSRLRSSSRSSLGATHGLADRPMTQQGLGGLKTAGPTARPGTQRLVQDRTYFCNLLRAKMTEIVDEISRLAQSAEHLQREQSAYKVYEKQARDVAQELKSLQEEHAGLNLLVNKLGTDTDIQEVTRETMEIAGQNDHEEGLVESILAERRAKEAELAEMELEISKERNLEDDLVASMPANLKGKYAKLKAINASLLEEMDNVQKQLDELAVTKSNLEEELSASKVKREVFGLMEKIREAKAKHASLLAEEKSKATPEEEREKLLQQVKDDNQEIATMEKRIQEVKDQIEKARTQLQHLEEDLEENRSEKSQQFMELKKREETMDTFLQQFESNLAAEQSQRNQIQASIVSVLEKMSRDLAHVDRMPSSTEFMTLQEDLQFKEGEMEKSRNTAMSLVDQQQKLNADLQKIDQLEEKIRQELITLKGKIKSMEEQLTVYTDLDSLRSSASNRDKLLHCKLKRLEKSRGELVQNVQQLSDQQETLKKQLNENDAHVQLCNLERKWQHLEQNNFSMKEFIAAKLAETNYKPVSKSVAEQVQDINSSLQESLSKRI